MRLLVVGASGYIGEPLFRFAKGSCVTHGTSTTGLDELVSLKLQAAQEFDYGVLEESDVVFVTAAISAPDICAREHEHAWSVNVTGTSFFVSEAIKRRARVIFFSSDTIYGESDYEIDENSSCCPSGDYAVMKYEVEQRFFGDPLFKAIRLSYVFSSDDTFTNYLRKCSDNGVEAEIFHPFYRAAIHREDVLRGAIALAQNWDAFSHPVINFGGPSVISRIEFAQTLKEISFPKLRFRQTDPAPEFFANRPRSIHMKSALLASLLGRPPRSLRESIQREFYEKGKKHNA